MSISSATSVATIRRHEYYTRKHQLCSYDNDKEYLNENSDSVTVPKFIALFSKSLKHYDRGYVFNKQFRYLIKGIKKDKKYLKRISYLGTLKLVNPSSIYSLDYIGPYKSSTKIADVPKFRSAEAAGEMVELYWMCLLRDEPFSNWSTSARVSDACNELSGLTNFQGPISHKTKEVEYDTLFRGNSAGDLIGPYVSQFLYLSYNQGAQTIHQKYNCYKEGSNMLTTWEELLSVQNGIVPPNQPEVIPPRYIITLRDGASYVHHDTPVTAGINALNILYTLNCPLKVTSSYEDYFVNIGKGDLYDLITRASHIALLAAWYHKWSIFKLRPEVYGMHVDTAKYLGGSDDIYKIHSDLMNSKVLKLIHNEYGSYVLNQVYPEGSPCHPAYPAGHATFAGAMTTILKAFFDEEYKFDAWVPNDDGSDLILAGYKLRVGNELNKLASNIAIFRNAAGVHYRSDARGIELGEQIALQLIKEHINRYPQEISLSVRLRNGAKVVISNCNNDY